MTQLDVDRKAAEASETKAAALQLQAATVRDELNYKIFALYPTNPLAKQMQSGSVANWSVSRG